MTILLGCALALASAAPQADLSLDDRLKPPVTIEASFKTMKEVLDDLAQRTGVALGIQDDLREDLITLYAKERPAHEVLARIALHFGWEWRKTDEGYTLAQSAEAAAQERRELEQLILEPFQQAKKAALERLQTSTPEALAKLRAELAELQKKIAEMPDDESEESYRLWNRLMDLSEQVSPGTRLEALLVAQMSTRDALDLERLGKLVYSTHPTALQRPMPRTVIDQLPALIQEIAQFNDAIFDDVEMPDAPEGAPRFDPQAVRAVRAVVKRAGGGFIFLMRQPGPDVSFQFLSGNGTILHREEQGLFGYAFDMFGEEPDAAEAKPERPEGLPARFEEAWSAPESVKKFVLASSGEDDFVMVDMLKNLFGSSEPLQLFGDVMVEFAKAMDVCFISDAYDAHAMGGFGTFGVSADSPALFLDSMARSMGAGWSYAGPWITVRTSPYALARATTVPRSVLKRLLEEKERLGGITFDSFSSAILRLTDRQATSPAIMFAMFSPGTSLEGGLDLPGISFCRMWGSLSPTLKEALKQGRTVTRDLLPNDARGHLDRYLYLVEDEPLVLNLYMDDFFSAVMQSAMEDMFSEGERPDDEFTQRFPAGIPSGSEIRLQHGVRPGVEAQLAFGGQPAFSFAMSPEAYGFAEVFEGDDSVALSGFRAATLEAYSFEIALTPNDIFTVKAGGATSDPKAEFGPFDSLPEELRRQMQQARERARRRFSDPPPPGG